MTRRSLRFPQQIRRYSWSLRLLYTSLGGLAQVHSHRQDPAISTQQPETCPLAGLNRRSSATDFLGTAKKGSSHSTEYSGPPQVDRKLESSNRLDSFGRPLPACRSVGSSSIRLLVLDLRTSSSQGEYGRRCARLCAPFVYITLLGRGRRVCFRSNHAHTHA